MYFLAKHLRPCSRSLRTTQLGMNLCKDDAAGKSAVKQASSFFLIHPEKLKQLIKAKDAITYFESDDYRKNTSVVSDNKAKILPDVLNGHKKYQHVINCAQPARRKSRVFESNSKKNRRTKQPPKTVFDKIVKGKYGVGLADSKMESSKTVLSGGGSKAQRCKTTIVPIFLEKIKQKRISNDETTENNVSDDRTKLKDSQTIGPPLTTPELKSSPKNALKTTVTLYPRKNARLPPKSRSQLLMAEQSKAKKTSNAPPKVKANVAPRRAAQPATLYPDFGAKKFDLESMLREADRNLERKHTIEAFLIKKKTKDTTKQGGSSLFHKVKIGSLAKLQTKPAKNEPHRVYLLKETVKPRPKNGQSGTYQIVSNALKSRDSKAKARFSGSKVPKTPKKKQISGVVTTKCDNVEDPHIKFIVDNHRKSQAISYLLRLPKTTPEGYRVLLYSVKDSDASKMNFNDVVKGFCMYNDVVLSEDGLQEGYIVLFDMKGVSIGHLARVSLPALKCFMYYIQDAHPCRLKAIHVLNTASWIQHVMRLIVPLTRSELLSLVRFHKGNVPEDFPIELLPMDYGGEAPTVEELDATTRELFTKYRDWLLESSQFKADESKRSKKASWWGLFGNKGPQTAELDEKTILKNLQID